MPLNFVAKAAITVGTMALNMALTMSRKIEGPRLDNTKFTGGDYGAPLHMIWGTRRIEASVFWAEDLREVKRKRKTKGGKFNEYTYYGTWAVALAGHEISGISRIWFDTHLVYDLTGAGPVTPFDFGASGNLADFITVYTGTETQEPDPRIQATVEAEHGEGSCPAYRGTAYVVFKDIPLEKLGNRIPQVSVEVVNSATNHYPQESIGGLANNAQNLTFSADYTYFYVHADGTDFSMFDTAARAEVFAGTFAHDLFAQEIAPRNNGMLYGVRESNNDLYVYTEDGLAPVLVQSFTHGQTGVWPIRDANGGEHWGTLDGGLTDYFYFDGLEYAAGFNAGGYFGDLDGGVWVTGKNSSTSVTFRKLTNLTGVVEVTVTGLPSDSGHIRGGMHYRGDAGEHFVFYWDSKLYAVDFDGNIVASVTVGTSPSFVNMRPGASSIWAGFVEYDPADLSVIRTLDPDDWGGGYATVGTETTYDPINHALIVSGSSRVTWYFLDRINGAGITLGEICADVADMVGVEDYDFTALDQIVQGWSATQGQASNMVEPLLDAYDSDIRPHDFQIQGIKRTGVSGGTILTERFVAGEPRYTVKVRQGAELPKAIIYNYADIDGDQQPNNVRSDRPLDATGARGEQSIDLTTWVSDKDEARGYADRHFRRLWNERKEVTLSLTAQQLALEPGDCRTLDLDGEADIYRLTRLTIQADDALATEWKYDHPSLAVVDATAGAPFDGRNESVIVVPLLSKGFALDIPLISDSDDQDTPAVYVLAAPYADGTWPGATMYQAVDGEYSEELAGIASSSQATWGYVTEDMAYANPNLWDRGTEITVTLQTGTLTGATEAAIDANPMLNLAAIGANGRWEIVQFASATLTAPLTYTLSHFKRGRRGTEWAAELHAANDTFVLLDTAEDAALGLSEVGTEVSFKAITAGRTTGFPITYTLEGNSLRPGAPCHLEAVKQSNGDWVFTWVRRTRIGGAWTSGTSIPLSEASEEYELDLSDGVDTVTKTVTGATTYTWTQAAQVADVGAEVMAGDLEWTVVQMSDAVGRGFEAEATA